MKLATLNERAGYRVQIRSSMLYQLCSLIIEYYINLNSML